MAFSVEDILLGDTGQPTTPEKAAAMAGALKRQKNYGLLGQMMNLQPTVNVGRALTDQAQTGLKTAVAQQQANRQRASQAAQRAADMEWKRDRTRIEDQRYAQDLAIRNEQLALQRAAAEQAAAAKEQERLAKAEKARRDQLAAGQTAQKPVSNALEALKNIDALINHPSRLMATGKSEFMQQVPYTGARDYNSRLDQITGAAFLQAFETLKGGGQITEIEGKKATQAITRLTTPGLSEQDHLDALQDLRSVVANGLRKAQEQQMMLNAPVPGSQQPPPLLQRPPEQDMVPQPQGPRDFNAEYGIGGR